MITTEILPNGFIKTTSTDNKKIQKIGTNEIYSKAVDLPNSGYRYAETEIIDEPAEG